MGGIGYGASTLNKSPDKVHDVDLPAGTQIGVQLSSKVTYYHRSYTNTPTTGYNRPVQVGIERESSAQDLPLPSYASSSSTAMDIYAANDHGVTIEPGQQGTVTTGLRFAIPAGYEARIRIDDQLAQNTGLTMGNGMTTIDSSYRGIVKITLINTGQDPIVIHRGDRIAQLAVTKLVRAQLNESSY